MNRMLRTSWTWQIGHRVLRYARRRFDGAVRDSMVMKALARTVGIIALFRSQAAAYAIAGSLCAFAGLMAFRSHSLTWGDVLVRSLLLLGVIGLMIRCVESADK